MEADYSAFRIDIGVIRKARNAGRQRTRERHHEHQADGRGERCRIPWRNAEQQRAHAPRRAVGAEDAGHDTDQRQAHPIRKNHAADAR